MTNTEWLRSRLTSSIDIQHATLEHAYTNWDPEFEQLCRNRLAMGVYRYPGGHMNDPQAPVYDNVGSAIRRLGEYLETGNLELLVDVANLCHLEFHKAPLGLGSHPSPRWTAVDDGEHTEVK